MATVYCCVRTRHIPTWCMDPARVQLLCCLVLLQQLLEGGHMTHQLLWHPVKYYLLIRATFPEGRRRGGRVIFAIVAVCATQQSRTVVTYLTISALSTSKSLVFLTLLLVGLHLMLSFTLWITATLIAVSLWLGSRVGRVKYWQSLILKKLRLKKFFCHLHSCYHLEISSLVTAASTGTASLNFCSVFVNHTH